MKKAKNTAKNGTTPDPGVLEGIPVQNPYDEYEKKDAIFKKRRGLKDNPD